MSGEHARRAMRWALAMLYFVAGVAHLRAPADFMAITPAWVPYPAQAVLGTGICEIAGAAALLTRSFRKVAGAMLAVYAACVFPANIKHALEAVPVAGVTLNWWYHAPRLALQPVLIWWPLYCGEVLDWPWRKR